MIAAGDSAPPLQREITLTDMIAYAGATWDWHRLHYDPQYLAAKGLPAPVVDGQMFGALLVQQVQDWLGPRAVVQRLAMRYAGLVFAGETVRCTAVVAAAADTPDGAALDLDCRVDVSGERERAAVAPASLRVLVRS